MSRRRRAVSEVQAAKVAEVDSTAVTTTGPKIVITPDPVFQPPIAAAELPSLDPLRPKRRSQSR